MDTALARLFHGFPHVDFNFHNATKVFSPSSVSYQQALLFNGIYLLFVTVCLFLIFGIYFLVASCYFCGKCTGNSLTPSPSRSRCFRILIGIFGVCSCVSLGIAFYGNHKVKYGVNNFSFSAINIYERFDLYLFTNNEVISGYVDRAVKQMSVLEKKLIVYNATKCLPNITMLLTNVQNDLQYSGNMFNEANVELKYFANQIIDYDGLRWWITIVVLCFHLLLVSIILYASYTNRKGAFIVLTVMAILSLLFMMSDVSLSVPMSIAAADICKNPTEAYSSYATSAAGQDIIDFYLQCDNASNLILQYYNDAESDLQNISRAIDLFMTNCHFAGSSKETKVLYETVHNATSEVDKLLKLLDCRYIHQEYQDALEAVCRTSLEGFGLLILSCLVISVFLIAVLLCITPLWKAVVPLRPILKKSGVHLVTDSYQGPPGGRGTGSESFHGSSSFDTSYKSIDEHPEDVPLISRRPHQTYRSVAANTYGSTEFLSVEEDDRRPSRTSGRHDM